MGPLNPKPILGHHMGPERSPTVIHMFPILRILSLKGVGGVFSQRGLHRVRLPPGLASREVLMPQIQFCKKIGSAKAQ